MVSSQENVYGDLVDHLPGCMDGLGDAARQAIELRIKASCTYRRSAELRRGAGAAKLLMFRARQALKNCLLREQSATEHD